MSITSAGVLLYRHNPSTTPSEPEVFLVRANLPRRDLEMWGVPKGRVEPGEELFQTAKREFREETGNRIPEDIEYSLLPPFKTNSGKTIHIYTADAEDYDIEWQKRRVAVTTITRGENVYFHRETRDGKWFPLSKALNKIGAGQKELLMSFSKFYTKNVVIPAGK